MKNIVKKTKAFSLLEIMVALVVVSIMLAVMTPVMTTKKSEPDRTSIQVIDATPVGVIVAWYGDNYPSGWEPLDGRVLEGSQYEELRKALGDEIDALPDINTALGGFNSPITWIIKVKRN